MEEPAPHAQIQAFVKSVLEDKETVKALRTLAGAILESDASSANGRRFGGYRGGGYFDAGPVMWLSVPVLNPWWWVAAWSQSVSPRMQYGRETYEPKSSKSS